MESMNVLEGWKPKEQEQQDQEQCEYTELIEQFDDRHSLVKWVHMNGNVEWVVCSFYDASKPVGSQWSWGHYYITKLDALDYAASEGFTGDWFGSKRYQG